MDLIELRFSKRRRYDNHTICSRYSNSGFFTHNYTVSEMSHFVCTHKLAKLCSSSSSSSSRGDGGDSSSKVLIISPTD